MLMSYATAENVSTRLMRPLSQLEKLAVAEFLDDVESDILDRYPDVLAGDARRLRNLMRVECAVVIRYLGPEENAKQVTRTRSYDDYSETDIVVRDTKDSRAGLTLTDEEWAALAPVGEEPGVESADSFTITPSYR